MNVSDYDSPTELTLANSLIYSVPVSIVIGIILSIFTLMTIVFNLGGALIFFTDKTLHTFSDCLIINLVIADGSIGLLVMPMKVILALTSDVWVWSRESCLAFITVEATTNLVSVVNTFIVTLDHYWLVRRRQKYTAKQTHRLLLFMCIAPWISVFVFFGSPHFLTEFVLTDIQAKPGACAPPFQHDLGIFLILLVSPFVPIIAVPVYDSLIYFTLRRQLITKVQDLLESGSIEEKYLAAFGIKPGTDKKSLAKLVAKRWRSSLDEKLGSKPSECDSHLEDDSASEATGDNGFFEIDLTTVQEASNELNSNCNADGVDPSSPSPKDLPADGRTPAREAGEESGHVAALSFALTMESSADRLISPKTANTEEEEEQQQHQEETAGSSSTEAVGNEAGHKKGEEAMARKGSGKKSRQDKKSASKVEELKEFATDIEEARLSLMLGTVLVITCTPFESLNFIVAICDIIQSCFFTFPPRLMQGCRWWVLLSSTINPVLIFTLDHRYKAGFFRFFRRLTGKSIAVESAVAKKRVSS